MIVARDVYVGMHKRIGELEAALAIAMGFLSTAQAEFIDCATLPGPNDTRRLDLLDDEERGVLAEYDAALMMARRALNIPEGKPS